MEMRIPTDKYCFNNFIIQNWKTFGDSVNKGIQKDVMCSFRKRTDVKQKTEDPKAQYISGLISISSGQRNLMKTYHNVANTSGITKIALKKFLDFF